MADDINSVRNLNKNEDTSRVRYESEELDVDTNETKKNISNGIKIEKEGEEIADKIKKIKEHLKKCQKEKEEYLNGWQRAKADFINYKKDEEKNRENFVKWSNHILLTDILFVLDSFDLALQDEKKNKNLELIKVQLEDALKKHGLTQIKAIGEKFNPEFHESVGEIESSKESGIIIEEVQKGYLLHNKVLRPTKVKIAK